MKVQPINIQNTKLNFGMLYKTDTKYTNNQNAIINDIKKTMEEPLQQFNGQTAENFYKNKKYDFIAEPDKNESVLLRGFKNLRSHGIGVNRELYADAVFTVGTFDLQNPLNVDDIKTSLKNAKKNDILTTITMLILGACISLIAFNQPIVKAIQKNNTPTELLDSISKNTKLINAAKK